MPVVVPTAAPVTGTTRDATSFDGRIRAIDNPVFGGVRLKIDYSSDLPSWSNPFQCTVYRRNEDGSVVPVRGGDPYLNYAGSGWLYDAEAPLGQPVSYYAVPMDASGTTGVQSASASIVTSAPAGGFQHPDMWLINLENPGGSIQARGTATLAGNYNGRSEKQTVLGSPFPVVTPDTRNGLATQISVLTLGEQEFAAMQELLKQSIILRKSSMWERPDGYFSLDDVSYTAQTRTTGRGAYVWQMSLTEVGRPTTYGQTVVIPGFSFANRENADPTFETVPELPFDSVQGGNMMDSNTSEITQDTSQWYADASTNSTISRSTTTVWSTSASLQITALASGLFETYTVPDYPVTPGGTYTFSAMLFSATGLVANLQIDWKDGSGTYLSGDSLAEWGRTVQLTPNTWTKVTLTATPVPGAVLATPIILATATAAGQSMNAASIRLENI